MDADDELDYAYMKGLAEKLAAQLAAAEREREALQAWVTAVKECAEDEWQCPRCGHADSWWTDSNADYATREIDAALERT